MNAIKKRRDKHSSRPADLRLRQPFSSWAIGLQVPRQPPPRASKYATLKRNTGILAKNLAFLRRHEAHVDISATDLGTSRCRRKWPSSTAQRQP
jgi:hypothetical protein